MRLFPARLLTAALLAVALLSPTARAARPQAAAESARQIPVAYDVDVVVVGGSSGAVSAAVAAAQSGARVFLAAPRPYLGEDLCATMRLWLEPGEKPESDLARKLFSTAGQTAGPEEQLISLPFTYQASLPSTARHKDTKVPSLLNNGTVGRSERDSVQYDGDVTVTTDLGAVKELKQARLIMFHRAGDFSAQSVTVAVSDDARAWKPAGTVQCVPEDDLIPVTAPLGTQARYVRFDVKRAADAQRLLLAEIALEPAEAAQPAAQSAPAAGLQGPFRPIQIKKTLDEALLAAGVQFLYGCYATDVLRDEAGNPRGIVMANRAGRQAVLAKTIIDATGRAAVARMAGAQFAAYPAGPQEFKYVVIGGAARAVKGVSARDTGLSCVSSEVVETTSKKAPAFAGRAKVIEYTLRLPMADGSFASFARAEQRARDLTWSEGVRFNTEEIFQVPPDAMQAVKAARGEWAGVAALPLEAFQPKGVANLYVLGGCADLPRAQAEKLLRPLALMDMGTRLGQAAAAQAKAAPAAGKITVAANTRKTTSRGEIKEILTGVRPTQKDLPAIDSPARALPVLGEYDVVVIGGGTGGAPAAISAARNGGKTLLVEYLHGMGGVGTLGLISTYYHGYRGGFTGTVPGGNSWNPLAKSEWWRATARQAGADIWFGSIGCGALVENGRVKGAVVATPEGRGLVLAKVVIDSTGNADIAAAAGAQTLYVDGSEPAVQGTGLPPIKPGSRYTNTDFTIVDETDVVDVWHVLVYAKNKYARQFDMGQLIDTRERRRIVGDFFMTLPDAINGRTYPDTIAITQSNFDTHGMTVDPYLYLEHPEKKSVTVNLPYRCLLPKGLEGVLVTGIGISAHRDVMPLLRMQPDVQNHGYAAGLIAATAAKKGQLLRQVNIPAIQKKLAALEIIPKTAIGAKDNYPLPAERIEQAVQDAKKGTGLAVIVTHPQQALPLLRKAFASAEKAEDKVTYARIMAVLRDPTGLDVLVQTANAASWDKGWNYTGMGQFGNSLSPVDTMLVGMARTGDKRALEPVLKLAAQLNEKSDFSHFRAVALACEQIGDPAAAPALARLLALPGMRGHVMTDPVKEAAASGMSPNDNSTRSDSLKELILGRALYRCGDKDGLGRQILTGYSKDLRGYIARHAQAVLDGK